MEKWWKIIKQTARVLYEEDPWTWSASIAFYVIFSLPAIVLITMSVAGSLYEDRVVRENLLDQTAGLFGPESAATIGELLNLAGATSAAPMAEIAGIGVLLFSATTVVVTLQNGLNTIWGIRPHPEKTVLKFVTHRLLSLAMVLGLGVLLLISLIVDTFIALFQDQVVAWFSGAYGYLIPGMNTLISLAVITGVFAMIFRVLPDARIAWRDVWAGALVTALLFSLGKFLIGFYMGNSSFGDVYGAAGSMVVMLIWVYYSTLIVLVGAKFTAVYARVNGRQIQPDKYAVSTRRID